MGADPVRGLIQESLEGNRASAPAVNVGEQPPFLELREHNGKRRSLASFRGRPTLLLFWNPKLRLLCADVGRPEAVGCETLRPVLRG